MTSFRSLLAACLSAALLAPVATGSIMAADTNANTGSIRYTGTIAGGGSLDFDLRISGGDITGTVTASPGSGFTITGPVQALNSYWENGRCYIKAPGPGRTVYEFSGYCTTDSFSGRFTTSGPADHHMNGEFSATSRGQKVAAPASAPPRAGIPAAKLTCYYLESAGGGSYELRFSSMGSITLRPDGSYITGSGKTGGWLQEGDNVRLVGGAWNNRIATLELDRSGDSKLVFRSVDPGITHCTQAR